MRRTSSAALSILAVVGALASTATPASATEPEYRVITFPVEGAVSFSDDFGDPRSGGRSHAGNDLMGRKMQPLLSTVDGKVTFKRIDSSGLSGNMLTIADSDGWTYRYIHVNNDTPGSDDGLNPPQHAFAPGTDVGSRVSAGQLVGWMGDSGNAEETAPHLHFEIRKPDGTAINPWTSLRLARGLPAGTRCSFPTNPRPAPSDSSSRGYYALGSDGGIFSFGGAPFFGSVPGLNLGVPVSSVRMATTPNGDGYWILGSDGGIFSFGAAAFHGSVPGLRLPGRVQGVELRATTTGRGYWILGADGGIFSFGDAAFHGSLPGVGVRTRAIRLVPTPTGGGYWILGADGGVFSFGDAAFHGSLPGVGVPVPPVAMASTASGRGYWLLGVDGGVFSFGDARFFGSIPGEGLCRWPKGMHLSASATGQGYYVQADDGSVWAFGDAKHHGAVNSLGLPVVPTVRDFAVLAPR